MSNSKPMPTSTTSKSESSPSSQELPILEPAVDPEAQAKQMSRRHVAGFLAGLSVSFPLAASISWLWPSHRRACPSDSPTSVPAAAPAPEPTAAPAAGPALRPRLLVILPEDAEHQYRLGRALGEYLNHAEDAALAPLAGVDLACIAAGEVELPAEAIGQGPLALLLVAGNTQRLVRFELPAEDIHRFDNEGLAERIVDERIAIMSSAVRRAVVDGDQVIGVSQRMLSHARVQEIATRARAGYGIADWRTDNGYFTFVEEETGETDTTKTKHEPTARSLMPDEAAHFAPALLSVAMTVEGEARKSLMSTLAEVTRRRVVKGEVSGAEWAVSGGCGTEFENRVTNVAIGCGMGHVPERSRRFLHFYTLKPAAW